ncbi:hypothetical protein CEXT_685121 [Caerostris extrusa]|uniref:Uncharacterized protein n=1 Tax=Caerostris extrusa TaxID=172846 RepID=A0AAV4V0I5_CAEEX|nr:hypothetical protein CEXT_685121 [Caerostris extrusa]
MARVWQPNKCLEKNTTKEHVYSFPPLNTQDYNLGYQSTASPPPNSATLYEGITQRLLPSTCFLISAGKKRAGPPSTLDRIIARGVENMRPHEILLTRRRGHLTAQKIWLPAPNLQLVPPTRHNLVPTGHDDLEETTWKPIR